LASSRNFIVDRAAPLDRQPLAEFAKMLTTPKCAYASFVAAVLAALLPASVGAQPSSQTNQNVALSPGTSTTIVLSENPSTGFKWNLDTGQSSNLAIVQVIDGGSQPAQSGLIGAPGSHRWQIVARAAGTAKIVFAYARPWEHNAPAETYVVAVDVTRGP
jgi:inhibitor of cysteine peptidase